MLQPVSRQRTCDFLCESVFCEQMSGTEGDRVEMLRRTLHPFSLGLGWRTAHRPQLLNLEILYNKVCVCVCVRTVVSIIRVCVCVCAHVYVCVRIFENLGIGLSVYVRTVHPNLRRFNKHTLVWASLLAL